MQHVVAAGFQPDPVAILVLCAMTRKYRAVRRIAQMRQFLLVLFCIIGMQDRLDCIADDFFVAVADHFLQGRVGKFDVIVDAGDQEDVARHARNRIEATFIGAGLAECGAIDMQRFCQQQGQPSYAQGGEKIGQPFTCGGAQMHVESIADQRQCRDDDDRDVFAQSQWKDTCDGDQPRHRQCRHCIARGDCRDEEGRDSQFGKEEFFGGQYARAQPEIAHQRNR